MTATPKLSIIIPHYQDLENLGACLNLLERQTLPREAFEIVVSDNLSPVGEAAVRAVVRDRARLVICVEKGAGPTRNAAVAAASPGTVLAFLDSDCRPEPGWAESGLAASRLHPVIGGRIDVLVPDPAAPNPVEAFEMVFAFDNASYVHRKGFSASANLFVRREVWDAVGAFRNGVSEDVDWCWRARDSGYPVAYAAEVGVGHPARRDWKELRAKFERIARETVELDRSRAWPAVRLAVRPLVTLALICPQSIKVLRSDRLRRGSDRMAAIRTLVAIRVLRCAEMLRHGWIFGTRARSRKSVADARPEEPAQ